jgi:hypothetical protein
MRFISASRSSRRRRRAFWLLTHSITYIYLNLSSYMMEYTSLHTYYKR